MFGESHVGGSANDDHLFKRLSEKGDNWDNSTRLY
jgi:hypothetical protein